MVSYLLNQMRYAPHLLRLCLFYLILLMDVYGSCGSHCNKHRAIKLWVNLLSHTFTGTHHIQQWGLENHRLPHFHVLPLTHKLHFLIFLIYLAKMMILALEKQRVNPRKIKSSMASIFRHGTRYAELGGRREKNKP